MLQHATSRQHDGASIHYPATEKLRIIKEDKIGNKNHTIIHQDSYDNKFTSKIALNPINENPTFYFTSSIIF